uniref:Uncharacterized protein n=1 Tax=Oryza barthii TaxID=65489 RepID=A0A0D3HDI6_9ORYZ
MARLRRGLEHLERRYAFYAAYHSNPANVLVHAVCVLHRLFGYEPTPGFYKRVQARVAAMHNGPPAPAPAPEKKEEEEKENVSKATQEESAEKDS